MLLREMKNKIKNENSVIFRFYIIKNRSSLGYTIIVSIWIFIFTYAEHQMNSSAHTNSSQDNFESKYSFYSRGTEDSVELEGKIP